MKVSPIPNVSINLEQEFVVHSIENLLLVPKNKRCGVIIPVGNINYQVNVLIDPSIYFLQFL